MYNDTNNNSTIWRQCWYLESFGGIVFPWYLVKVHQCSLGAPSHRDHRKREGGIGATKAVILNYLFSRKHLQELWSWLPQFKRSSSKEVVVSWQGKPNQECGSMLAVCVVVFLGRQRTIRRRSWCVPKPLRMNFQGKLWSIQLSNNLSRQKVVTCFSGLESIRNLENRWELMELRSVT